MFSPRFILAFLTLFLFTSSLQTLAAPETSPAKRCAICGMNIKNAVAHSFDSVREAKPTHFCSYGCAVAFHKKYPQAPITAYDYETGKALPAADAFYVVKSDKLADEFKFAMAPVVVAFASEGAARKVKDRVKEGEVVKGFSALEHKH